MSAHSAEHIGSPKPLATAQEGHVSMSLQLPDSRLAMYTTSHHSAEITDVVLDDGPRAVLTGQIVLTNLVKQAREQGIQELLVTSGPLANQTVMAFWSNVLGKPVATAEDYYGPNYAAAIWRTDITAD